MKPHDTRLTDTLVRTTGEDVQLPSWDLIKGRDVCLEILGKDLFRHVGEPIGELQYVMSP